MHRLHLLRHAKSSRDEGIEDEERPLSRRGRDASRRIGEILPAGTGKVDLVLCSNALRTRETLDHLIRAYGRTPAVSIEDGLYLATVRGLLERIEAVEDEIATLLVIGHNPGLHELAIALAAPDSPSFRALAGGKFPTTARASFAIDAPWSALGRSRHWLADYVTSKSLGGKD